MPGFLWAGYFGCAMRLILQPFQINQDFNRSDRLAWQPPPKHALKLIDAKNARNTRLR